MVSNNNRQWVVLLIAFTFTLLVLKPTQSLAQEGPFRYSVKFVCSEPFTSTFVNIHNPQSETVEFSKKAVIALPQDQERGPISPFVTESLDSDQALEINCKNIRALFPPPALPPSIEGFVVIDSPMRLDVVAKTVALSPLPQGMAMDTQYIVPRRLSGQFVYSVKFLCGPVASGAQEVRREALKAGNYATAINVHNFSLTSSVSFRKKAVIASSCQEVCKFS